VVQRAARALGYELIARWRVEGWELSKHLEELFRKLEVRCVLDVGANVGQYYRFLRHEVGYQGLIVSFEPVAAHVERLRALAVQDSSWLVCPYALGRTEGTLTLNVMRNPVLSSFLKPDTTTVPEMENQNIVDRVEEVRMRRLDQVLAELDLGFAPQAMYLKLDTQGFDLEVLDGAGDRLREFGAVQTELSWRPLYRSMPDYRTALQRFDDFGFQVTGLFPVVRDSHLRIVEMDCVLINGRLC